MTWIRLEKRDCDRCDQSWYIRPSFAGYGDAATTQRTPEAILNPHRTCPACRREDELRRHIKITLRNDNQTNAQRLAKQRERCARKRALAKEMRPYQWQADWINAYLEREQSTIAAIARAMGAKTGTGRGHEQALIKFRSQVRKMMPEHIEALAQVIGSPESYGIKVAS